jgi:spore coat polysaccharide biosynthesis protein SpsF
MSEQVEFWQGSFGDSYINRNSSELLLAANVHLFAEVLNSTNIMPKTILEFGANIGMNIHALKTLIPEADFTAVEVNEAAGAELKKSGATCIIKSAEDYQSGRKFDLVLTKGVLIHISPANLDKVYQNIYDSAGRWVLFAEYYNPTPVSIPYRGHDNKLFKRDFAGEFMDRYSNVSLISHGFAYHRSNFPQDDITWFLMEVK